MEMTRIGRNLIVLGTAAALLTGCGGKDEAGENAAKTAAPSASAPADNGVAALEPTAIVDRAKTALKNAKSFQMKGTIEENGQQTTLDLKASGADLVGTMTMGEAAVQLLRVGGDQYLKAGPAFWKLVDQKQADTIVATAGDKWVNVPSSDENFRGLFAVADIDVLMTPEGKVTKGPAKVIAGTPTIGLVDDGPKGGTLYVATAGEPYPLLVEGPTAGTGSVTFSSFGATFADIKAPEAANVVDLAKITS